MPVWFAEVPVVHVMPQSAAVCRCGLEECIPRLPDRGDQLMLPPNRALELTPRGGERDRVDFDGWKRLDCIPDLHCGAADGQAVGLLINAQACEMQHE